MTDLVPSTDLIRPTHVSKYTNQAQVETDLAVEDIAEQAQVWEHGTAHERQVATAYRALEDGRQLIDLNKALEAGGKDSNHRPKLAVCRVGIRTVHLETWATTGRVRYGRGRRLGWSYDVELEALNMGPSYADYGRLAIASTPTMPPHVRKIANRNDLLFWEATWRRSQAKHRIVIDPVLLEHVVGALYVVKAAWELSELEAAALST